MISIDFRNSIWRCKFNESVKMTKARLLNPDPGKQQESRANFKDQIRPYVNEYLL